MQLLIIAGTVGKDAVLRQTQSGDSVLGFRVAVDNGKDKNGVKRDATWVSCSLWGKRASSLAPYITKGTKLTLQGRPTVDVYEGKGSLGISVDDFSFMSKGQQSEQTYSAAPANDMDDEVPF
jgi:single-strand DNA-binding protein